MDIAALIKQANESEQTDRANAFELGFARAAKDAHLTKEAYEQMRAYGLAELQKAAAGYADKAPAAPKTEGPERSVQKVKSA